jgi:hydroxyacylglutathione hydrolase
MLQVSRIVNDLFESNTYIISLNSDVIIIDPGSNFAEIQEFIVSSDSKVVGILATHGHFDHIYSVQALQEVYKCRFFLHSQDQKVLQMSNFLLKVFGINRRIDIPKSVDYFQGAFGEIQLGDFIISFYNFPGHTRGSCVFYINNELFTGDTLYFRSSNRAVPDDNSVQLKDSIESLFKQFHSNVRFHPGHGRSSLLSEVKDYYNDKIRQV